MGARLRKEDNGYAHWCPACEAMHFINVTAPQGPNWSFDGHLPAPSFQPSVRIQYNGPDADTRDAEGFRRPSACCHYFLLGGKLVFQSDCSHALAGTTVPLPDLPPELQDKR